MAIYKKDRRAYSIGSPFANVFNPPIISNRVPTTKDKAPIGTLWVYQTSTGTDDIFTLASIRSNSSNWICGGGGSGTFDSLAVANNATIGGTLTLSALTAGTVISSAAGVFSVLADGADGEVLIGTTGGASAWSTLTAGAGINITEAAGAITITNPGATGTAMIASDANQVDPDGAGHTNVIGYDTNITTDGAVANTLKVRLADNVVSVGSITATNDLIMSTGTCTITSDDNAANAIYLHADAGVNETIHLHVDQGTAANSVTVESDVGGLVFASGLASANAVNITASDAAGGVDVDFGTGGMSIIGANGVFDVQTGTANITIGADATDHDIEIGDAAGVNAMALISGTGHTAITSTGNITLDATGVVELNSSADTISIGNDGVAQNMNFGTGAAARVVTIGNTSAASQVVIDCGTAGVNVGTSATAHTSTFGSINTTSATTFQSGTGAMTVTSGGILDVNVTDAVTVDSTAGTLSFGAGADNFDVNLATGGTRTTIIGSANTTSSVVLNVGTGNLDLGVSATSHTTRVGSTSGTSALTLQSGTGATTVTAGGILDINGTGDITIDAGAGIFDLSVSGNMTFDSSGGTIGIGVDDIDQHINIGSAGERTITVGNQVGAAGIIIESGTTGMAFNGLGLTSVEVLTDTQAAAAVTVNGNNGAGIFTGLTTASAASQQFTITNSVCTVNSRILATVANVGANDAKMTLERVKPLAGSFTLDVQNNGTQALNGNVIITFWILTV